MKQTMPRQSKETRQGNALEVLRHKQLRVTTPRKVILALLTGEHGPFTIDEIHQRVRRNGVDRVTVYRCLAAFEEIGLVRRCDFGDGSWRYEYSGEGHHHHHVICRRCRRTEVLDHCAVEKLEQAVRHKGYRNVTHSLEFFGLCPDCQKRAPRPH